MRFMLALVFATVVLFCSAGSMAQPDRALFRIERPCVVEPPPTVDAAAAFMTIKNISGRSVAIVGVASPVAEDAMLHETYIEGRLISMRHVKRLPLEPNESIRLSHGAYHIMLKGLRKRLKVGDTVKVSLILEDGSTFTVEMPVCRKKRPPRR